MKYALSFVFKSHGFVILLSQIIDAKRIFSVLSSMSVLEMSFSYVLQRFVTAKAKESENLIASTSDGNTRCDKLRGKMSGEEARTFYETVLSSESSNREGFDYAKALTEQELSSKREKYKQNNLTLPSETKDGNDDFDGDSKCNDLNYKIPCSRSRISSKCVSSYSNHRIVNQFLQYAQEGRLRQVKDMLSSHSIDIDVCDQFSWTALMCASHSGQVHVVKYLLEKGADWRLHKDLQGRTALDLAIVANHFDIVELLRSYNGCIKSKQWKADLRESKHSTEKTKFWCSVCEQEFTDDEKVHKGSTVHLFNIQRKPQKTFYYIPEGNVGYQMMLKSGWNDDKGLFFTNYFLFAVDQLIIYC